LDLLFGFDFRILLFMGALLLLADVGFLPIPWCMVPVSCSACFFLLACMLLASTSARFSLMAKFFAFSKKEKSDFLACEQY